MRISDHFSGNYYRAEDFTREGINKTIDSVELEKVGRDEKLVLHFRRDDKGLPLNKTNATEIAELYGDETDDWAGKQICVYQDKTEFGGKRVPCMRIKEPLKNGAPVETPVSQDKVPF